MSNEWNSSNEKLQQVFSEWSLANGTFLGLIDQYTEIDNSRPNFKRDLITFYNALGVVFTDLNVKTELGMASPFIYLDMFSGMRRTGKPLDYAFDMGLYTMARFSQNQNNTSTLYFEDILSLLTNAARNATRSTLHLLKEAMESNETIIVSLLKAETGYLYQILVVEQFLNFLILQMVNPDEMVFIPTEEIDAESPFAVYANSNTDKVFHLGNFDFDNENIEPYFSEFQFFRSPNKDGAIYDGQEAKVMFRKGTWYNIMGDGYHSNVIGYIAESAKKIVHSIQL